ncbi:MAG: S-layer homology domain-containing protein [Dehalobacterium sp.]
MKRKLLSIAMVFMLIITMLPVTAWALSSSSEIYVSIEDGVSTAVPGTEQTYTITVFNNGLNDETGVGIYCTLPEEIQNDFTGADNWTVASTSGGAVITGGSSGKVLANTPPEPSFMTTADLPAGAYVELELTVKIRSSATGSLEVSASITGDFAGDTDYDTLMPEVDLAVTIDDSKSSFNAGDSTVYAVAVTNTGPSKATGASLSCPLPDGATDAVWGPDSYAEDGYASPMSGTGALVSSVDLDAGGSYHFWFRVDTDPVATGTFSAVASFTAPPGVFDDNSGNNSATDTNGLASEADMEVWIAFGDQTGNAADEVTFDVNIYNHGPSAATGITLSAPLPVEVTLVSAAPDSGTTYDSSTGVWTVGTLEPYDGHVLTIKAAVDYSAPRTMTASVLGADMPDPDTSNNSASLTVTDKADVALSASVDDLAPDVGDTVTITVTLANNGPDNAAFIRVIMPLPSGLTYESDAASSGYYDPTDGWFIDSLVSGGTESLEIQATVSSSGAKAFSAQVESAMPDPDTSNNSAGVTVVPSLAFVPVTGITGVPTTATAGTPLTLSGTVAPTNATNQTIVWSLESAGTTGTTVSGNTLSTTAAGIVTVRATITNGLTETTDYTQDFDITVNAASTYTASVSPTSKNFTAATAGYGPQTAQEFTIENTGTGTITGLSASLADGTNFEISTVLSSDTLNPGGTATVSIRPKTGLAANTYTDTLTITGNNGISLTVTLSFTVNAAPSTDKTLVSITAPTAITGVANGTEKSASALGLPSTVTLVTDDGSVQASVTWAVYGCSYDPSVTTEQTFMVDGTVTLPSGVVNTNGVSLDVTISVTVLAATSTNKTLVSIVTPSAITGVTNGTAKTAAALGLPGTVTLVTNGGNVSASVSWDVASSSYNVSSSSAQTFTVNGTVTLPAGVINPDNVPLSTTISVTVNARSNGGGNNGGGGGSTPSTPTYDADVKAGNSTETTIPVMVNKDNGSAAIDTGSQQFTSGGTVITMPTIPDVDTYTLGIPVPSLSTPDKQGTIAFKIDMGSVTVPSNMLTGVAGINGNKAEISIGQGDKNTLPEDVKAAIGDRPLVQLTLSIDGKQTDWSNPDAPVTVSIPYTPTAEELANPESIVIWYIDGSGNVVTIPNEHYDPATGTVTVDVTHFSYYAVAYNKVSFNDVASGAWYNKAVSFIAARGITTGTGNGKYSPEAKLTRGEFIVLMMRAYGITPDENPTNNFADAGNTYYTGYLAAAKRLGISSGVGNNTYAPGKEITRQEMFTLLYNALKVIDQLPQDSSGKSLSDFTDVNSVADWAEEAMTLLVKTGTIGGSNGALTPLSTTTRAEMAQVLYNLLGK